MSRSNKLYRSVAFFSVTLIAVGASAQVGETKQLLVGPERLADRVSLALTGNIAQEADKLAFAEGRLSMDALIDKLASDKDFETTLARYWSTVFKITSMTDFLNNFTDNIYQNISANLQPSPYNYRPGARSMTSHPYGFGCSDFHYQGMMPVEPTRWWTANNDIERAQRADYLKNNTCGESTGPDSIKYSNDDIKRNAGVFPQTINPWWAQNPSVQVKVFPGLLRQEYCGPRLEKCFPGDPGAYNYSENSFFPFWSSVQFGMTMEPGILAARIIRENRPWKDVVTTKDTVMNGPQAYFIERWGADMFRYAPAGTFDKFLAARPLNTALWVDRSQKVFNFPNSSPSDHSFTTIDRQGAGHAGVLTTVAWQRAYNGERAKANGAVNAFLCKTFVALPGSKQVPSNETDLTKRPYCADCHASLDPMANFFNRWSPRGTVNFKYVASKNANGVHFGVAGSDVSGYGAALSNDVDFASCGVKRAFEILVGRPPNAEEQLKHLPELLEVYNSNGGTLLPVFKAISKLPLMMSGGG